jgi:predicted RNA polymerase sigma factor
VRRRRSRPPGFRSPSRPSPGAGEDADEPLLLEDQDRSLWDAEEIAAGRIALEARALALRGRGPYVLQAAIASLPAEERIDGTRSSRCTDSSLRSPARRRSS